MNPGVSSTSGRPSSIYLTQNPQQTQFQQITILPEAQRRICDPTPLAHLKPAGSHIRLNAKSEIGID